MQRCGLVKNTPTEGIEPSAIRLKAGRSATELCGWCVFWCTCTRAQIGTPKLSYKTKTKTNAPMEGLEPPTSRHIGRLLSAAELRGFIRDGPVRHVNISVPGNGGLRHQQKCVSHHE